MLMKTTLKISVESRLFLQLLLLFSEWTSRISINSHVSFCRHKSRNWTIIIANVLQCWSVNEIRLTYRSSCNPRRTGTDQGRSLVVRLGSGSGILNLPNDSGRDEDSDHSRHIGITRVFPHQITSTSREWRATLMEIRRRTDCLHDRAIDRSGYATDTPTRGHRRGGCDRGGVARAQRESFRTSDWWKKRTTERTLLRVSWPLAD